MSFMRSYKRLDNLCKDLLDSDKGVSSYIEEMENKTYNTFKPANWNSDYYNLKRYRHIRNQIAHDTYAEEEDLCNRGDIIWIEDFHIRILNSEDPLAQYLSAKNYNSQEKTISSSGVSAQKKSTRTSQEEKKATSIESYLYTALTVLVICIGIWMLFGN